MEKIARVFPHQTKCSPTDSLSFFSGPGLLFPQVDRVHISVTFSWDIPKAEKLYNQWKRIAPTEIGGPAFHTKESNFIPGQYLKFGSTITSRGCPNKCWFCDVWKTQGTIQELPIMPGWLVYDSNLFACSLSHLKNVFQMLSQQPKKSKIYGVEAKSLDFDRFNLIQKNKSSISELWFAYDTPDDLEPLMYAGKQLNNFEFSINSKRCYVLIGYPGDSIQKAETRLKQTLQAGFLPFAMRYTYPVKNKKDRFVKFKNKEEWHDFQYFWQSPRLIKGLYLNKKFHEPKKYGLL